MLVFVYLTFLSSLVAALPSYCARDAPSSNPAFDNLKTKYVFKKAGSPDLRSPCPGLNAFANHGILPRNGRDITVDMFVDAQMNWFNVSRENAAFPANLAMSLSPDPASGKMTLADLNDHGEMEHDGSLSREDAAIGDHVHFSKKLWAQWMNTVASVIRKSDIVTPEAAAKAKEVRLQDEVKRNEDFFWNAQIETATFIENVLLLHAMVDPQTQAPSKKFIHTLFAEERLDFEGGWAPPKTTADGTVFAAVTLQLAKNTHFWPPYAPTSRKRGLEKRPAFHALPGITVRQE